MTLRKEWDFNSSLKPRALVPKLLLPFCRYGLMTLGRSSKGEVSGAPWGRTLQFRSRIDRNQAEVGQREWEGLDLSRKVISDLAYGWENRWSQETLVL